MDAAGKTPFDSLADAARARGMRVGLATSVAIDDATPSVFCAHASSRGEHTEIAAEMMASPVEFLAGNSFPDSRKAATAAATKAGRRIAATRGAAAEWKPDGGRVWFAPQNVDGKGARPFQLDQAGDDATPTLAELTGAGIRLLDNPNGFFLMVESGRIDWACHANDPGAAVGDVLALDQALAAAVAFYREHPADTLILVTADHETGGLALGRQETGYALHPEFLAAQKCSAVKLTEKIRAWRAAGKSADEARALLKTEWLDWGKSTDAERAALAKAYAAKPDSAKDGGLDPLAVAGLELASRRAGIAWSSHAHTGAAVPVTALGAGQDRFIGWYDNTEICRRLRALIAP
jgi:alkaline phosphatase